MYKNRMEQNEKATCRFCIEYHQTTDIIIPCKCKGSIRYVHTKCLAHWMETNGTDTCNICLSNYNRILYIKRIKNLTHFLRETGAWMYVLCGIISYCFLVCFGIFTIHNNLHPNSSFINIKFLSYKINEKSSSSQANLNLFTEFCFIILIFLMSCIYLNVLKQLYAEFKDWQRITIRIRVLDQNRI